MAAGGASQEMLHAYRHLYRAALRAVQYSKPARFAARDTLREAFRARPPPGPAGAGAGPAAGIFDPAAARRTVWFLRAAAREAGLEHRVVRGLLRTAWARRQEGAVPWGAVANSRGEVDPVKETAYRHYDLTVAMLNKTMGLCLR